MPPTNANPLAQTPPKQPTSSSSSTPHQQQAANSKDPQQQQQLRPPLYNAEDYAAALRALFTTSLSLPAPPPTSLILEHATTHPPLIPGTGIIDMNMNQANNNNKSNKPEMSMKKFINGSELLFKLEADLRSAFPSFVQEFVNGDSDGVTCILDALRMIHEALDHVQGLREQRKLVMDERSCVQCCSLLMRNIDSIPKLLSYAHGLYPLVHCTVSTNTSTRVLALEILTSILDHGGVDAYAKVSEAISTLRLRLGEPIRCKVLVGAISSAAAGVFQATGIRFFKSFIGAAPSPKYKVYLQVELEEAGFNVDVIRKSAEISPARESRLVLQELDEWDRMCIDVDTVVRQNSQLRNSVATLQQEIATLKDRVKKQESTTPQKSTSSSPTKYTKKKPHSYSQQQQQQQLRHLSSTPIQTITTPVDSEEEAEQIHQILEDLNNIVNNEMLNDSNNNNNNNNDAVTTTTSSSSDIVPVLTRPQPPQTNKYGNLLLQHRPVQSEPNLLFEHDDTRSSDNNVAGGGSDNETAGATTTSNSSSSRVKHVVQQLENSNVLFSSTLPNFNTGGLASKFANFKSSKLDGGNVANTNVASWCDENNANNTRVKSLENLDNFTLKWKYPVVDGGLGGSKQQPSSLLVLQDYRMNRFNGKGNKEPKSSSNSGGLFSKNKKKNNNSNPVATTQQQYSHPQKTFQINLVKDITNNMYPFQATSSPTSSSRFNDLGGSSGGSNSPERVTDLPSGMY